MYYRNRYDYYGRPIVPQQIKFTNLVAGHRFYIVDAGKTPDGLWAKCDFCGMRLKYWVAIKREKDGIKVKVGRTCLERAGLMLTKEFEAKMNLPKKKKPKMHVKPKNTKEAEKKEKVDLDEDLLKMLDDIF